MPTDSAVPADPATPAPVVPEESKPKVLTIPTNAMKQIKQEERDRGRAETLAELDAQAVSYGFANHAEMVAFAQSKKSDPEQPATTTDQPAADPADPAQMSEKETQALIALRQEKDKLLEEKRKLNRARAREEKRNRQLSRDLQNMEATMELKLAAKDAGVEDVDYAVEVFRRAIKGMSDDELKTVDESKFFRESLRQSHPHLFKAEERPVNTGTPNTSTAKPGAATADRSSNNEESGSVDARKLPADEFQKLLRKRGLSNPSTGGMLA